MTNPKTVLITGANKGIGFETARQMAGQGYQVYLGSRDAAKGEAAVQQLQAEGLKAVELIEIDVSNVASIAAARAALGSKTGVLDVLINNAGISGGFPQPAATTSVDTIRQVFDTDFFGAISVTHAFLDLLRQSSGPRIVNVTSGLASLTLHSDPSWQFYNIKSAAYGPAKTALNAWTIALAYELRDTPFKVNAVDPGYTKTDFNHQQGFSDIPTAAGYIVRYATLDATGPTGSYISYDNNPDTGESPW